MVDFMRIVRNVIERADVLVLLLDSRMVEESRNLAIEESVRASGKPLIYVITKCDLVERGVLDKWNKTLKPCVFVSATKYHGLAILKERLQIEATRYGIRGAKIRVGVLGYPNVGKSSLVNAMTGRGSAQTSSLSGHTKAKKFVAVGNILFIDTPGVIPLSEQGDVKHALFGAVDYTKEKDPDMAVMALIEKNPGKIEKYYGVSKHEDSEETIAAIALKKRVLAKGNVPDIARTSVMILKDWQEGKIR